MNNYELTVVLSPKTTAAKKRSLVESIEKMVKILKGGVGKVDDWGVIDLAYKIAKNEQGFFLNIPLKLEAVQVKQLDTKLKMDESILRYLIVKS
jgi:small subunit ribosomal protein S6